MFNLKKKITTESVDGSNESDYLQGINNLLQISAISANESETTEEAFQFVLNAICLFMNWSIGHIYLVNDKNSLDPSDIWYISNREKFRNFYETTMKTVFVIGEGLPGRVLGLGKPAWIEDITKDLNFVRIRGTEETGLKAAFGLPIMSGNKIIAVMEFFNERAIKPDYYFLGVANQIGAQLGRIVEKKVFSEKLSRQVEELEALNEDAKRTSKIVFNIFDDLLAIQRNLRDEKNKTQKIVSAMGSGLLVVDDNFQLLMMNNSAEILLDVNLNKTSNLDIRETISVYKRKEKISWEAFEDMFKRGSVRLEDDIFFGATASGKVFPVTVTATYTTYGNKENSIKIIIFQDATVEKKFNESRENFISTASHQLRTPLTSIRWYVEMLKDGEAGEFNKTQADFLNEIYIGAERLSKIINLLLIIARIETGRQKISLEKINIKTFTEEILKNFRPEITKKHLTVTLKLIPKTYIFLDKIILNQLIVNLFSNAVRYTDNNGKIEIAAEKNEEELIFSIKDNGIGIPQNQQKQIFDKFFRADNAVNKEPDGNGLGLALVKSFVELWQGKIWFESPAVWQDISKKEEQKGTIFYFTVPLPK